MAKVIGCSLWISIFLESANESRAHPSRKRISGLPFVERTKANHREVIKFFNRRLILRGYLAKGTDWFEGVQKHSKRKLSEIEIYSPNELTRLLRDAGDMTSFFSIAALAGLRHAEIARLDWSEIEFLTKAEIQAAPAKNQWSQRPPAKPEA